MMKPRPNLIVIRCEDIDAAARFYRIIGLEFEKHRHGTGPEHYAASDGIWTFELYPASAKFPATSSARIGFAVESCDVVAERLREAGFSLEAAPADSPWGRRAVAQDPDGHRVELSSNLATVRGSDYANAFDEVAAFLRSQGVEPEIDRSAVATLEDVARFREATGIELPSSFSGFFTSFANGFEFAWESGDEGGAFSMPDLATLADRRREWVERVSEFADEASSMDQCVEPDHRAEAFRIWGRMRSWVPFIEEADGDAFCLDLASGAIVFDKHDWFDGFGEMAETNGMIAGASLLDFIRTWGRFSFAPQWFTDAPHPATQTHLEWIPGGSRFEHQT